MKSQSSVPTRPRSETAQLLLETLPSVMGFVTSELRRSGSVDNPVHFRMLRTLRRGGRTLHELAELHSVRLPTMSRTVSVMESRGWVRRDRSTEDRRTVHVTLTDSGLQALVEVEEMAIRRASMLLDCLSEAENLQLHDGLRALFGVVQEELGAHFEEQLHPEEAPGCTEQAEK